MLKESTRCTPVVVLLDIRGPRQWEAHTRRRIRELGGIQCAIDRTAMVMCGCKLCPTQMSSWTPSVEASSLVHDANFMM